MSLLVRVTDFVPSTLIKSQEMDDELNQLVNLLSGVSTTKDTLLKFSDGTNPVLRVDQLGAGKIQQWLQNGSEKARIDNDGSATIAALSATLNHATNPVANINQIGAGLIQRWQNNGTDRATLSALGKLLLPAGIGASPSSDQISNFGTYFVDPTVRATGANTNETDFSSKTISANVLATDGDFLIYLSSFLTATNANTKRYRVYFGSQVVFDTTALALNNIFVFVMGYLYRRSSAIITGASWSLAPAGGSGTVTQITDAGSQNFATTNTLKSTGQNGAASANDIQQFGFIVLKGSV